MTKDEFLSMVDSELDNLRKKEIDAERRVHYFEEIDPYGKEYENAVFQYRVIDEKITELKKFLQLPIYTRIVAMSDIEIEDYKNNKVEELELELKEIESREEETKTRFAKLKEEQDQIITGIDSLSASERDIMMAKGKQIYDEMSQINNEGGLLAELREKKEKTRIKLEQVKAMSLFKVQDELLYQIENVVSLENEIFKINDPDGRAFAEFLASVASDSEKAHKLSGLLADYRELYDNQKYVLIWTDTLPKPLYNSITFIGKSNLYGAGTTDKMMEIVQEFKESFEQAKESFSVQFTEQKLLKLGGKRDGVESFEVDMEFLKQHEDKLSNGELEQLQNLVTQRNKLSKKILKPRSIKEECESLNNQIKQEQSKIYKKIIEWYESQCSILGARYYDFKSREELSEMLSEIKKRISVSENSISFTEENILKEMEQKRKQKIKRSEILEQIRTVGDEKYREVKIYPEYTSDGKDKNLDKIIHDSGVVYADELKNRVRQEAQNQADMKEAELRNITIEQLLQLKNQAQAMNEELTTEISQGMKR